MKEVGSKFLKPLVFSNSPESRPMKELLFEWTPRSRKAMLKSPIPKYFKRSKSNYRHYYNLIKKDEIHKFK